MKRNNKKGFTIVELTIVIAVIAILAAVLIPTFSSVVDKANQSADIQLIRQANVVLQAATADGSSLTKAEAEEELKNNSITLGEPSGSDSAFYYLEGENRYVLFNTETDKITYPEDLANKPLVTLWVSETEQYYMLADSENPLTKVPVPTLSGKTFMGFYADGKKTSLNHSKQHLGDPAQVLRLQFIENDTWLKNENDSGRLFEISLTIKTVNGNKPTAIFNDQGIKYINDSAEKQSDNQWKISLSFYISKNALPENSTANYATGHRFLQFQNVPHSDDAYQIEYVTVGGVRYYGADGTWTSLAQFENENITLYAHWE